MELKLTSPQVEIDERSPGHWFATEPFQVSRKQKVLVLDLGVEVFMNRPNTAPGSQVGFTAFREIQPGKNTRLLLHLPWDKVTSVRRLRLKFDVSGMPTQYFHAILFPGVDLAEEDQVPIEEPQHPESEPVEIDVDTLRWAMVRLEEIQDDAAAVWSEINEIAHQLTKGGTDERSGETSLDPH